MENNNFLVATTPSKQLQVKRNKANGRVLVPQTNIKGHLKQTFNTSKKAPINYNYLNLPFATMPSSITRKGGKRRRRRYTRR